MKRWTLLLLTFGLCAGLYLLTLTGVHTYDALSYILDVDRKPWRELFHPHHLAYGALGALIRGGAGALGWAGSAERLLQGANALAGAAGVAMFGALAGQAAGKARGSGWAPLAGATGALLLATSYAYWYYAVEVEVYTIAAVFLVACLWLLLALAHEPSPRLAAALGLAQGCAVLFHQTNVLLCAPALVALALAVQRADRASALRRWSLVFRLLVAYGLPLALVVGGAYLWVGLGVSGLRSWGELAGWMAGYTTTGLWGGPVDGAKAALLGQGLAASIAQPGGALLGLAILAVLLVNLRRLRNAPGGAVAICLSWLLVYGAFFLWWEPDNIEFWIASLPPFYLLVVLAAFGPHLSAIGYRLSAIGLIACGLAMLALNYGAITRRGDAALDLQRVTARALAAQSRPGDLLVVPDGLPELYLPFYESRDNVLSLSQAMAATHGDWPAACALLRARVDGALAGGYAVLVGDAARRPEPAPRGEPPMPAERFGLSPDTVAACYEPYGPALEPVALGPALPGYARITGAQALADGPGWDFTRSRWGWRAANAEEATSALPGWALRPGADPALTSPPLRIEAGGYRAVEVRMAADTAARDAQLFFRDEAGLIDEARSVRWALAPGAAPETYQIDLSDAAGWQGVVTGLRLDPVGVGDGGVVVVEWIRLVR
jgi:hypothetical protein